MNDDASTGFQEYTHHRRLPQEPERGDSAAQTKYCGASPKATRAPDLTGTVTGIRVGPEGSPTYPNSNGADCEVRAVAVFRIGGRYKDRTCDPFHVKEVLYR